MLLVIIIVAGLEFGFAAERLKKFVDDGHDALKGVGGGWCWGLLGRIDKSNERGELGVFAVGKFGGLECYMVSS